MSNQTKDAEDVILDLMKAEAPQSGGCLSFDHNWIHAKTPSDQLLVEEFTDCLDQHVVQTLLAVYAEEMLFTLVPKLRYTYLPALKGIHIYSVKASWAPVEGCSHHNRTVAALQMLVEVRKAIAAQEVTT